MHIFRFACGILLLCAALLRPTPGEAAPYQPGFRTLGICDSATDLRMDINLWYPALKQPFDVRYGPWQLSVARNGKEAPGGFPLLLLSHDTTETRFSHHETAAYLARSGFVVAALTHPDDNMDDMRHLFSLPQLLNRVQQLSAALTVLLTHPDAGRMIDPNRVGILGFGTGGTAALLIGGALPSAGGWFGYCQKAGADDAYCSPWAKQRMERCISGLPLKVSPADVRVKSVAAVAPGYGMLFETQGLRYLYPPLLLVSAEREPVNRTALHSEAILAAMPRPPYFDRLQNAATADLMSACPGELQRDLPELCGSVTPQARQRLLGRLNSLLGQFFLETLGDPDQLARIPAPPDLTPAPVPAKNRDKIRKSPPRKKKNG